MARGFASGLVHGALLGALTLAGLAVLLPPPRLPVPQPALSPGAQDALPLPDPAPAQAPDLAVGAQTGVQTGAQTPAQSLDLPAGSGFARPTDLPPRMPDSPAAPPTRSVPGTLAPRGADESGPPRDDAAGLRPDAAAQSPAVRDGQLRIKAAGEPHDSLTARPLPDAAPTRQPLPLRPADISADAMPVRQTPTVRQIEPARVASDAQPDRAPARTDAIPEREEAAAPDLSTPPDFGALRLQP
ncbi:MULTISPECIES: hypothetical protein [unclassified Paracoccus (in: a-proteobacteria)]|uniref:hypothetical protein n=1 Tax=unclassified Paracoccus (in: a-proteobacteria) TaxID=2688777 RepID=UPI0012B26A96|nr:MULTISPECIES: hypothetical protein [unclassified Paracoccus (in: a-proteobacteria)]UXU73653.1 hypothetical protein GB879_006790 [Paracoccus sp. SMMA_5]UXU79542.1 hypothetical protein GB880_006775 [Paracoccus sp. SMMA_5_TC]